MPGLRLAADSRLEVHGRSHTLGEPLDALLARRPGLKPPDFDRFFDERGQQDLGAYLYGELFRDLSPAEERDLDGAGQVDLVIVTDDPYFGTYSVGPAGAPASLPGRRAVDDHAAHSEDRLDRHIDLPHASRLLIAAPNPRTDEYPDTEAEEHLAELEAALRTYRPQLVRGQQLSVVATWPELRKALTGQGPEVLYYYGHADADRQLARLVFPDPQTGVRQVPVADLAACLARLPQPPPIVYLNCCHGDAGGVLGAGGQLASLVPAVVSNRTLAFVRSARLQAKRFLEQTLLFGAAPHEAVRELYGLGDEEEFTLSDPRWMTPVCYRGYGTWHAPAVERGEGVRDPYSREKLDREYQFGIVFDKTHRMLVGGTRAAIRSCGTAARGKAWRPSITG